MTNYINPLQNDKLLDWSKFKAFADVKSKMSQIREPYLERVENIVGKGENAGYQHFLFFPRFKRLLSKGH